MFTIAPPKKKLNLLTHVASMLGSQYAGTGTHCKISAMVLAAQNPTIELPTIMVEIRKDLVTENIRR